jgi:CHAT domain-containing protein
MSDDRGQFFLNSLHLIAQTKGNPEQVYDFWQNNLDQLDEELLLCIPAVVTAIVEDKTPEAQTSIAAMVRVFGNLIQQFPLGNRRINLEAAITALQYSLKVFTRADFPVQWAGTQNNLGLAYSDRIEGDRKQNLEAAITALQYSLEVFTRTDFPVQWATIQNNLGLAYYVRIEGDRKQNLEAAITALQYSLEVRTRKDFPVQWALTQNNLGAAYSDRIEGDRKQNREDAITAYRFSLEVQQPHLLPLGCLQTAGNLGNLAFQMGDWSQAIEAYSQAFTAIEKVRSWELTEQRRQEILNQSIGVYENMLQSCINANRLDLALQTIERIRSKRLVDLMATPDLYLQGQIPEPVSQLLQKIADTQGQIDGFRSRVSLPELAGIGTRSRAASAPPSAEIQALEAQKQSLRDQLSRFDAVSAQLLDIQLPDVAKIQTDLVDQPDVALLSFYTTDHDTHILVVRQNTIHCFTCAGQGFEQLQRWLIYEWLKPYVDNRRLWRAQMPLRLAELAEKLELNRLIAEHLQDVRELILIPHLLLHLIPFAALPLTYNTPAHPKPYFGDRFLLRYAPGCQVLKFCTDRAPLSKPLKYGTVENATEDLPFAAIEGEAIAKIFQIADHFRLRGPQQATPNAYRQLLDKVNALASCHHASSRLDNPLESALILGNNRRITLGELLSPAWRFANLDDVFLSCCETGMAMPQSFTDELLTLGTGFLCAGARSVLSSLWAVSDLATACFSQLYHQERANKHNRITALQTAQQKLRKMTGAELRTLSQTDFIPGIEQQQAQLEQQRQNARQNARQNQKTDSTAAQEWAKAARRYGELIDKLATSKANLEDLWQQDYPFNHPIYWAPFVCQGLR